MVTMGRSMVFLPLTRKVVIVMSRSKNVRSKYQEVPEYIRVSVLVRDSEGAKRSRDSRGRDKHAIRAVLKSIVHDTVEGE